MSTPDAQLPAMPPTVDLVDHPIHRGRFTVGFVLAVLGHILTAVLGLCFGLGGLGLALAIAGQVLLLAGCLIVGFRALGRGDRSLGRGVLIGWVVGAVLMVIMVVGLTLVLLKALSNFE